MLVKPRAIAFASHRVGFRPLTASGLGRAGSLLDFLISIPRVTVNPGLPLAFLRAEAAYMRALVVNLRWVDACFVSGDPPPPAIGVLCGS